MITKIIRQRDLPEYTGLKRTQLQKLIDNGEFPKPIRLAENGRAKGWIEREVELWQLKRLAARDRTPN
jgi:predicted DNA-binding transcriptional regulator AlpA